MKESILVGFADLGIVNRALDMKDNKTTCNLHFNNAAIRANIQDFSSELMREICN
jgi:hypothetical protein